MAMQQPGAVVYFAFELSALLFVVCATHYAYVPMQRKGFLVCFGWYALASLHGCRGDVCRKS